MLFLFFLPQIRSQPKFNFFVVLGLFQLISIKRHWNGPAKSDSKFIFHAIRDWIIDVPFSTEK